jgi:glycosyltransferase involved in cell wall biosynthesis
MARILMIAYTTYVNDARVKRHARALADRGDHIDLLCLDNPQSGLRAGVNVIGLKIRQYRGDRPASYLRSYIRFFATASKTALKLGLGRPYDVIIVCTMPDAAVLCALPLKFLGSRVLLDIHDTMPELYREKFRGRRGAFGAHVLGIVELASTWFADRVLAVHELHRLRLKRAGVKAEKIAVVLNVPDQRIFNASRPAVVSREEFTVVCHGTITERLGLDVAIRAMAILRPSWPQVKLLAIGAGDYLEECKSLAARLELTDTVRFHAPVALEQLPELLRPAALGLVPNRASSATHLMLPVKLLEYAALGVPVVAARLQTIEHYFSEAAVRFFEPGDPADLAAAIADLNLHPHRREQLSENAIRTMQLISWPQQRDHYYEAIDSLLERGRGGDVDEVLDGTESLKRQRPGS